MLSIVNLHPYTVAESDTLSVPLWDVAALGPTAFPDNAAFVKDHVSKLLTQSFPNMQPVEVRRCKLDPGLEPPRFQILIVKRMTVLSSLNPCF